MKAEGQLTPAEKALDDTGALMPPMKETVDRLKELLQDAEQKAPDATEVQSLATAEKRVPNWNCGVSCKVWEDVFL